MFFLWYCFDDRLATLLALPELGHIPWWVALVLSLAIMPAFSLPLRDDTYY